MREVKTTVYSFDELRDKAKEKARDWVRSFDDLFAWSGEYWESLKTFADFFGVKVKDYQVGPWQTFHYDTNATDENFRGVKLSQFKPEHMPTGFCADCELWETFYKTFKSTGSAKIAFGDALEAFFKAWRNDWESVYSDDQIEDFIICNDYEFTADGKIF